ncbi:GspH/FimT family protein [Porticoccaceae bacterium LTM1]|nr:GspH/FimT family protein [Porticoccaceae bacterium LTM1]
MFTDPKGFTLSELLVAVAIVAILAAAAAPSFQTFLQNSRVSAQADCLMSALQLMRMEAIKRNSTVRLCQSQSGRSCDGISWNDGWLMWVDTEGDGSLEAEDSQEVIRYFEPISDQVVLTNSRSSMTWIGYRGDGTPVGSTGMANSTWSICHSAGGDEFGREIVINRTGRARRSRGADCGN